MRTIFVLLSPAAATAFEPVRAGAERRSNAKRSDNILFENAFILSNPFDSTVKLSGFLHKIRERTAFSHFTFALFTDE